MRVLFWSGTFWPSIGGVEVLAAGLLPALRERGYDFVVVAPQNPYGSSEEAAYQEIPIYRFPFQRGFATDILDHVVEIRQKVAKLKHTFAPDLVHINAVGAEDFFYLTTTAARSSPLLVTLHGEWPAHHEAIVGQTLRAANWVAGCSAAILDRGRQLVPGIASRSSIIHNGIETPPLPPEPLPFDAPRLLCLGRLAPEKGVDLALAGFVSVVDRFPQARMIIAGDGPLRGELQRQVADSGVDHAVNFVGWVAPDQVPSLINTSTIVLVPSRQDSFSLVALEAALMARPVVATRVGGIPEVVQHEETGLLVDSEDSGALAEATIRLLSNPETAITLGGTARARAQEKFSWERYVDAYDALYQKLVH